MCLKKKPVRYVETYGDWVIGSYKTLTSTPFYIAVNIKTRATIEGCDLPDLKADIDEAMR